MRTPESEIITGWAPIDGEQGSWRIARLEGRLRARNVMPNHGIRYWSLGTCFKPRAGWGNSSISVLFVSRRTQCRMLTGNLLPDAFESDI